MITSDEEMEYDIFALFSDIGGGLGIFLGLSFLRLVNIMLQLLILIQLSVYLEYLAMRLIM